MEEKPESLVDARAHRRVGRRASIVAGVCLACGCLAAAIATAPPGSTPPPDSRITIEALPVEPQAAPAGDTSVWSEERIARGETWSAVATRLGMPAAQARDWARSEAARLPAARHGTVLRVLRDSGAALRKLRIDGPQSSTVFTLDPQGGYEAASFARPTTVRLEMRSAFVDRSLFAATDEAGIPDAIASRLAEVFAGEIDFLRDLRRGDHFSVLYEVQVREGEPDTPGRMLAAEFVTGSRTLTAVHFDGPGGSTGWYTADGRNLRHAFLRSPMEFSRISSGFSESRLHPILQTIRAHKGIDYSAPVGTRVLATGDGVVAFAGVRGGYGNVVELRHRNGVSTVYGHLSGFGPQVRSGMKVSQADVVGYVGMTGLATGPHLHYEYVRGGVHVDPLRHAPEPGPAIATSERARFATVADERLGRLALIRGSAVAALE
jgi:murein DD-endopeptidase MepM/ murein hydrolase activator NlpD